MGRRRCRVNGWRPWLWVVRCPRFFRMALLLFYGRFGLPIPFEVPILYVIGRALRLPKIAEPSKQVRYRTGCPGGTASPGWTSPTDHDGGLFPIPDSVLARLLSYSKHCGFSSYEGRTLGVSKLPLHRLCVFQYPRVIDGRSLDFAGYGRNLDSPQFPTSLLWTPVQTPSGSPASSPLPSPTSSRSALTALEASTPREPFKALNYATSAILREQRVLMNSPRRPWRTYPSLFPYPVKGRWERLRIIALQAILLGSFAHVPLLLYLVYKKFCTDNKRKAAFFVFVLLLVFYPIPVYGPSRRWGLWKLMHRYHRTTVIVEDAKSLPTAQPTIYTALPHGVVPVAQALLPLNDFNSILGSFRVVVASIVKRVPIWGHFALITGAREASRNEIKKALLKDEESVVLVPGGIAEMYEIGSEKDIESAQKQYLSEVRRIFETYKGLYGWKHKSLDLA
ncbi:mono- or diacylglycerol acyltransferase [Cystoisospora suis]|uniref:Acyltransferase n=1 Tax=Cystoisospora suis TaxID=483139 RepID=A0A2C6L8K8_9APIC|nr:mono- or diacylglycerol acyltransferase [Cystoisospora suis]